NFCKVMKNNGYCADRLFRDAPGRRTPSPPDKSEIPSLFSCLSDLSNSAPFDPILKKSIIVRPVDAIWGVGKNTLVLLAE
ncbi:hypothetical protein, partial [Gluconobacter thailandicus]|uniref:hypothetical protein n=1 Tax=Gluconobacter thailandicus TaxID=257438 RepID=UPI001EE65E49